MTNWTARRHPVLDLLFQRAREGSQPGRRSDGFKLGIAFEGGGMRGVVSAGMGVAVEQLDLLHAFDVVYGASAGALNGAFFVSRQGAFGITIYYEGVNNSRFISLRRLLLGRVAVSLDYLVYDVMRHARRLDCEAVINSPIPLKIVASSLTRRSPVLFDHYRSPDDLLIRLKASALMPVLAGPPVTIDGESFVDASLYEGIPVRSALNDGCTHLLVMLSRPRGILRGRPAFLERRLIAKRLAREDHSLYDDYLSRAEHYAQDIRNLMAATDAPPPQPPYAYAVQVGGDCQTVSQLERRRSVLVSAAAEAAKASMAALMGQTASVLEVLHCYDADGRSLQL